MTVGNLAELFHNQTNVQWMKDFFLENSQMIWKRFFFCVWENVTNSCAILKNIPLKFKNIHWNLSTFAIRVDFEPCGPFMHKMCHILISKFIVNIVCNALCAMLVVRCCCFITSKWMLLYTHTQQYLGDAMRFRFI